MKNKGSSQMTLTLVVLLIISIVLLLFHYGLFDKAGKTAENTFKTTDLILKQQTCPNLNKLSNEQYDDFDNDGWPDSCDPCIDAVEGANDKDGDGMNDLCEQWHSKGRKEVIVCIYTLDKAGGNKVCATGNSNCLDANMKNLTSSNYDSACKHNIPLEQVYSTGATITQQLNRVDFLTEERAEELVKKSK